MACADVKPRLQLTTSMIMKYDKLKPSKEFDINFYMAELHQHAALSKFETISVHSDCDDDYARIDLRKDM